MYPNGSEYFTPEETGCRCGKCERKQGMRPDTIARFDALRKTCGFPLPMSSGYRCPLHPDNPGGSHGEGSAGDLRVDRAKAFRVLEAAFKLGFTGIGVKQEGDVRFIHLDDSDNPERLRPTVWSY